MRRYGWGTRIAALALVTAVAPAPASASHTWLVAMQAPTEPVAGTPVAEPAAKTTRAAKGKRGAKAAGETGQREAVVVLPIPGAGLNERLVRTLDKRVADGLRRGQFTVIAADEVRASVPAGECGPECLRGIAGASGARYLVRTEVTVEGRDYNVKLALLRADTGEPVVTSAELCEICGHEELADRVGDQASSLRRKLGLVVEPPPRLRVLTRPHGSEVMVDGVRVGVTPLDTTFAAGDHEVTVHKPGFVAYQRSLRLVEGATETIADELLAVPVPASVVVAPPPRRLAPAGWAALAVGIAATGAGVGLIVLDERPIRRDCSGENIDAEGNCKWRHNTLAGGVVLGVAGVAAIAVGVALLVVDRKRSRRSPTQARVWPHASGLTVRF